MYKVLYEDNHLLVANKPAGMLVHDDITGDESLLDQLKDYLKKKYQKPGNVFLQPCHRLDRPVSGCLVFARTSKAIARMNLLFRTFQVQKTYLAVSDRLGADIAGELRLHLLKDRKKNTVRATAPGHPGTKVSETHYRLIAQHGEIYLWELLPKTGRSHQLRVAMQQLGMPIIGDLKYGASKGLGNNIALHCRSLTFTHPVKQTELTIECEMPDTYPWNQL